MTFHAVVPEVVILLLVGVVFAPAQALGQEHTANLQPQVREPYFESITQLQNQMRAGEITSAQITRDFIWRIELLDQHGPKVNSVIQVNPNAMKIARERDRERKAGKAHGPLFGIPFLVKDNIDTAHMQTTAGSLALVGPPPSRDATVVAKLRAAGAVLLGRANLSEWAYYRSRHGISGWSAVGGLTHNPYVLSHNTCGSSAGSAAAVSAGFATFALGTDTGGSIICPSSLNGVVGIRPSLGLVSRAGVVPVSLAQDVVGPIVRSTADAAAVLTVIAGSDPRDRATVDADKHAVDYTKFLRPHSLRGKRIGVVCAMSHLGHGVSRILNHDVAVLRAAGATVEPVTLPHSRDYYRAKSVVLSYSFKADINAYLKTRKGLKVKTLADIIAFNRKHRAQEMPWFGQDLLLKAEAEGPLTDKVYTEALAKEKRLSGPEGIDAALKAHRLDALMAPAQGPAWATDLVDGDHFACNCAGPPAAAGYPAIAVPGGNVHGLPVDMLFFAGKWSEPTLISIAYGFEQATRARIRPHFLTDVPEAGTVPTVAEMNGTAPSTVAASAEICPQQ